jgi:hypothetical protein
LYANVVYLEVKKPVVDNVEGMKYEDPEILRIRENGAKSGVGRAIAWIWCQDILVVEKQNLCPAKLAKGTKLQS